MKVCPTCQGEFADEYSFCPKDSAELSKAGAALPLSEPDHLPPPRSRPGRVPRLLPALAIAAAAGLGLLVILYALGLLDTSSNADEQATATTKIPPPFPSATPAPANAGSIPASTNPNGYKYNFEDGAMGWEAQKEGDSRACVEVSYSDEMAGEGKHSLKVQMELDGENELKRNGEAWVNMLKMQPGREQAPVNLRDRTVTAWVYGPPGSQGDRSRPNGFQIFVKDKSWKVEYGSWKNVEEGRWVKLSLNVSASSPSGGFVEPGFDPGQIIAIGIRMGVGGSSIAEYKGAIYVDAVDW